MFGLAASTSPAASILEEDPALICLRARADADIEAARHLHRVALVQGSGYRVLERTRARIASRLGNARRAHAIVSSPSELRARTRVRRCTPGARTERESPLTREDLWLTEERLPAADNVLPEHECGLCHSLKSHPVQ
jgi:hypothetical protein